MIRNVVDIFGTEILVQELIELSRRDKAWVQVVPVTSPRYEVHYTYDPRMLPPMVRTVVREGGSHDVTGLVIGSEWFRGGPKLVRPTDEQAESMAQIAINLTLHNFSQPFDCVCVETPKCDPFICVLVYRHSDDVLMLNMVSADHTIDIVTMIRHDDNCFIEDSISIVDEDCEYVLDQSKRAARLALNMCLSLTNFGCQVAPIRPKERAMDEMYAREVTTDRAKRARQRLSSSIDMVSFTRNVVIRRPSVSEVNNHTGRTMPPHWVRGHWKMQAYGKGSSERKRILIAPYLVHAEEELPPTPTVYRDAR